MKRVVSEDLVHLHSVFSGINDFSYYAVTRKMWGEHQPAISKAIDEFQSWTHRDLLCHDCLKQVVAFESQYAGHFSAQRIHRLCAN
jgi:hypothetical protein